MNSAVSVTALSDDLVQITTIIDDEKVVKMCVRPTKIWDMSAIPLPIEKFNMNPRQAVEFAEALESNEGRAILELLKNRSSDNIINRFLKGVHEKIKRGTVLAKFVEEVAKQPLLGHNMLNPGSLGLTKREIFDKFVQVGLIQA